MSVRSRKIEQNFKTHLLKKFTNHALARRRKYQIESYPATRVLLAGNFACFKEHNTRHRLINAPAAKLYLAFKTSGESPCAFFQSSYDCIAKALNKGGVQRNGKPLHSLNIPRSAVMSKLQKSMAYDTIPDNEWSRNEIILTVDCHLQRVKSNAQFNNLMQCDKTGAIASMLFNALKNFTDRVNAFHHSEISSAQEWHDLLDEFDDFAKVAKSERFRFSGYPFGRKFELLSQKKKLCIDQLKTVWDSAERIKSIIVVFNKHSPSHCQLAKNAKDVCDNALNVFAALREQPEMTT